VRSPDKQRGLASLELALCLPLIMGLVILAVTIVQIGHRRLEMQSSARNTAYAQALGLTRLASTDSNGGMNNGALRVTHPAATSVAGGNFIAAMGMGHARFGELHAAKVAPTTVAAHSEFFSRPALGGWQLTVSEEHSVVAAPIWEREALPLGYDRYLRARLKDAEYDVVLFSGNASYTMPDIFPKAR